MKSQRCIFICKIGADSFEDANVRAMVLGKLVKSLGHEPSDDAPWIDLPAEPRQDILEAAACGMRLILLGIDNTEVLGK